MSDSSRTADRARLLTREHWPHLAVLVECAVDLVYAATPRYYFSMWLLAALVAAALVERRLPALSAWTARWGKASA